MTRAAKKFILAVITTIAGVTALHAQAEGLRSERSPWRPDKAFAQIGGAEDVRMAVVGATWDIPALRGFVLDNTSGYFEASIGRWESDVDDGSRSSAWVTQVGLTPVLRWHPFQSSRWFTEAGIGVNVVAPIYRSSDKRFSTVFNFGDHVGLGVLLGDERRHELTLRFQHFSNAGIKEPNPGENFLQLRYSVRL